MNSWQIGDVRVTRLQEQEPVWPGTMITGQATAENVLREGEWLKPFTDDRGHFRLSIHSLLVESEGHRIVVDTCVGNNKVRPGFKDWNNLQLPFLQDFEKSFSRESIDMVVCTHLHLDHVGWNTVLENGKWTPTFPKARYMMTKPEWDHVRPVIDAKLADLVQPDHRLTGEVWLESTPGHTPGHVSVRISSRGENAVITGDMIHHPIQVAHPDWICDFDNNPPEAAATRQGFVERYCDQPVKVFGTHFAGPTGGHIARRSGNFRFEG